MALDLTYDDASAMLTISCSGVVTLEDRIECFRHVFSAPEYAALRHLLVNVSEVTNAPMDGDLAGVINVLKGVRARIPGRIAVVNSRAGHVTISNLIAMSADPVDLSVKVFLAEEGALTWILG